MNNRNLFETKGRTINEKDKEIKQLGNDIILVGSHHIPMQQIAESQLDIYKWLTIACLIFVKY